MKIAAAGLWLLLLGAPDPVEKYLKQQYWYGEVVFRRSEAETTGSVSWSRDWRARIEFRMEMGKVDALVRSSEREWNRPPPEGLPAGMREAYEKQRQAYQKALGFGGWMGDMKQAEELWLTETRTTRTKCGGRCGDRGCNATGSEVTRRSGYVKRGPEIPKLPKGFQPKSFADINHIPAPQINTLSIDTRRKTFDLKIDWNDKLWVTVLKSERKPHGGYGPGESSEETGSLQFPKIDLEDQPLPEGATSLHGSIPVMDDKRKNVVGEIDWTLSPKPLPAVDLWVTLDGYATWRPEGSMSEEEPGNHIEVSAWLEAPGGGAVEDKATSIWFLLTDVSNEPGSCINYPPKPKFIQDSDLRFLDDYNSGGTIGGVPYAKARAYGSAHVEGGKTVEAKTLLGAKACISSFDWGGSGILQVQANLESGRRVYGALRGRPGDSRIRIPKSDDGSRIADGWKEKTGATGKDDDDDEKEPVGDARFPGDGLTLYEEYRGWHEDGYRHADEFDGGGDPNRKELFVCDRSGMARGFALDAFATSTGLRVVGGLAPTEISEGRVVNFNHGKDTPHRVDQHAAVVYTAPWLDADVAPDSHATGTPGSHGVVYLSRGPAGPTNVVGTGRRARELIHNLLHSCNVDHHAPRTTEERVGVNLTLGRGEQNEPILMEGAVRTRIFRESDGVDVTAAYIEQLLSPASVGFLRMRIGSWQGSGSGHSHCVMCNTSHRYFRSRRSPGEIHQIRGSELGRGSIYVCDKRDGAMDNGDDHRPEPHFGPAPVGRGACLYRIAVNDIATQGGR